MEFLLHLNSSFTYFEAVYDKSRICYKIQHHNPKSS